jgi:hypothetical protein
VDDAAKGIVAHYERHALSWDMDRRAAPWIDKPCIERFLNLLQKRWSSIFRRRCSDVPTS